MAQNNNTSNIDTVVSSKAGLITDLNATYIPKEAYSYARNAVRNSKEGDLGTIGNEPSNLACIPTTNKIVGTIDLPDDKLLVFSGEGDDSEIGIGDINTCSYTKLSALGCYNFDADYPVTGVAKKEFQKGAVATFTDKKNPVRRIELDKVGKITDCDDTLLFKKIMHPCLTLKKGQSGNVPNGSYSVAIAYVVDNQVFSDWYSITNRIQLYSETNSNSIEVRIDGIDSEFKQYALAVVGNYIDPTTKGATKLIKNIGTFSTKTKVVSITDFINSSYEPLDATTLVIKKNAWTTAGIISSNSNYLIIADLVAMPEENYQLKALQIEAEYVVEQVPADYYEKDGEDVGYYRDENYDFYIQGVDLYGNVTDKFVIVGRKATATDRSIVSSADVFEHDSQFKDCSPKLKVEKWQVENTAQALVPYNNEFVCNRRVLGYGKMGYHESSDPFPDNKDTFGDLANTPRLLHKMPDEAKVHRYEVINGKTYINILGVRFKNIPKFDNPAIIGYKITRSDRKGGNGTVIARGLMTNLRGYRDDKLDQDILYSNYTVNDLRPDEYLSSTQTAWRNGAEQNFNALTQYYNDKFSFYSPHTMFEPRYTLSDELKIESEEIATVRGNFEKVYKHPKGKLLNQFSFWLSAAVGFLQSSIILLGKTDITTRSGVLINPVTGGPYFELDTHTKIENINDLVSMTPEKLVQVTVDAIKTLDFTKIGTIIGLLRAVTQTIIGLGLKIPYSIFSGIREADTILQTIYNFTGDTDYVYQYNAHAEFNRSLPVKDGDKRRRLLSPALYIPSDVVSIDDKVFHNYFREPTVYMELNKPIADPSVTDNTRGTISSFGACDKIEERVTSTGSAFYATSKAINSNQYGRVGSAPAVSMHSCSLQFANHELETPILYGGDCIIARFQFQKRMKFFSQNMANTNFPDETEYDYRLYRNIAHPRFWMDTTKYDFSQLLSNNVVNYTKFSRTTTSKYNLDCKGGKDGKSIARIDDAYMYLSNNCVMDFFVECDYNIHFREKTEKPFYSKNNTNLSQIFRSDRLEFPEEFKINRVFSDLYTTEIYAQSQREDFDPANPIPVNQPNSVIYSLPSFNLQNVDSWQYFLPANYFAFKESDFGSLTGIHKLDQDRIIFLFSKSSPYISVGRDFLELENSGRKITIGDGGLFAQDPREVMPTDNNYGACNSRYAFSNTHLGKYFPSEKQGRIFQFAEGLDDITRQGISYWCKNYMPITLYKYFPNYPQVENPLNGVGYLTAFDSFNETVYITKRDFSPKKEYADKITYVSGDFHYNEEKISLRDSKYFNDISWTLSYSPLDKSFISFHDWHPDWVIQTDNHFMTVKDNIIWKHNERFDDFCNFYGVSYPFEIQPVSSAGQQVETVRSLQYLLEVYKYKNFGRDRFHVLNENFSHLIVKNTEQISPLLNMSLGNPNPEENLRFPKKNNINNVSWDIPFFKEENKYTVNMFWDATRDRGEFTNNEYHLFPTDESGYKSVINPVAIDINKPEEERKKFRHYWNEFRLIKDNCGPNKFIFKLLNIKKQLSIR